jgi:hypothetical protein
MHPQATRGLGVAADLLGRCLVCRELLEQLPALFKASYPRLTADLAAAVGRLQQRPSGLGPFLSWMAEVGPLLEAGAPGWAALLADVEAARRLAELMRWAMACICWGVMLCWLEKGRL